MVAGIYGGMEPIVLVLLIAAVILFGLATFNVGGDRFSLGWAGLACWALSALVPVLTT